MLHQGRLRTGLCSHGPSAGAFYKVYIVIFSSRDIAYDIRGLRVIDLHMGGGGRKTA